jgi:hypothetical protein
VLEASEQMQPETELAREVDAHLQAFNCEYAEKRRSGRIGPVQIRLVPSGTWNEMRRRKSAARGNFEEYKHPCLIGDLDAAERIGRLIAPDLSREPVRSHAAVDGP